MHLYFRYPSPQEVWSAGLYAREMRNSQGLLGNGLDVRGEGGYVVAPPSSTARAYRWIDRLQQGPTGCSAADARAPNTHEGEGRRNAAWEVGRGIAEAILPNGLANAARGAGCAP